MSLELKALIFSCIYTGFIILLAAVYIIITDA